MKRGPLPLPGFGPGERTGVLFLLASLPDLERRLRGAERLGVRVVVVQAWAALPKEVV